MDLFVRIAQFIVSLSFLIVAHELGHFFFARLFKVRVEKFYLFFNPWFSLFKFKHKDTEYGMGWLPLGGYVKIAGMIDESMDTDQMAKEPQPWEFRTQAAWKRLLIMIGGVLVNFVLALVIYSMMMFTWGTEYIPVSNATYGYEFSQVALDNGFQNGDKLLSVDGQAYEHLNDAINAIALNNAKEVVVERNGEAHTIQLPADMTERFLAAGGKEPFASPRFPFIVGGTQNGKPAAELGVQIGDRMVAVDEEQTESAMQFVQAIRSRAGKDIDLTIQRGDSLHHLQLPVTVDGTIGVQLAANLLETKRTEYSFGESIPAGVSYGFDVLGNYIKNLKLIFSKEGVKQLGGFGTIAQLFPGSWDWLTFWNMTAFLSIILAFMNILPIPALDGGHVLFLLYEMITRRKPSEKFLQYAQLVGMFLLFALLIVANGNDILRWLGFM